MTQYQFGLNSRGNFGFVREAVDADNILDAIRIAEERNPGLRVHTGWAMDGGVETTDDDLERWMHAHHRSDWKPRKLGTENGDT